MDRDMTIYMIIGSNPKDLDWQFTEDNCNVELFNYQDKDVEDFSLILDNDCFNKSVDYIKKVSWYNGYQEDWDERKVTITDEDYDYSIEEIIEVFCHYADNDKKKNQIKLINIKTP